MNLSSLLIAHRALSLGSIRETARRLKRPAASVSSALGKLQAHLAVPLVTTAGNRILPTLEGRRIARELSRIADLVLRLAALQQSADPSAGEQEAARLSISLLALSRFIVVARTGSIRSAALEIGMGQPQLTRQMKTLEADMGIRLLQRAAAGATPTPAGEQFLKVSQEIEKLWLRLSEPAGERFRRLTMRTNLGSVAPLGRESLVARILAQLAAQWPKQQPRSPLYISSSNAEELLSGLSSRLYDVVLLDTLDLPPDIEHRVLSRSGLCLVGARGLVAQLDARPQDILIAAPIALPSLKSGLRQKFSLYVEDVLTAEERAVLAFTEIDSIPVIANLVLEHGHLAVLPEWATIGMEPSLSALRLPSAYDMQLSLAWRKTGNAAATARLVESILAAAGLVEPEPASLADPSRAQR
ncbi:LysR family transcriptional regulator [Neorhizobium lilium]|uniref:LysR family transcriptional regulator n=1 Tax=Neorhizobium lilium TaxID=2503024 RepID=A0A3S3RXM4_9HYPH|nr:LysR family transcriptional regulator [Neorhizobium lilium]RWX80891.1 LysR family transcriptional regulator [Neorhizobium lilium]